ncbi:MAG: Gfo/Idh/MocA family oxidoreductase [Pirellulales bacterium]|nr:Gfo/Idh/MocA family oxidoreductase [Pirellulales bacterium]
MHKSLKATRRDFLRTGGLLVGSCVVLPTLIPRSVLASVGRPGANDRIGIGYIGAGRRARQLMNLPPERQFVGVSDVSLPRAKKAAAQLKCKAFQDYRRMLELKELDAVMIASPDHWHALHAVHACQAGKDVYCEKPMTLTIREGRIMVAAARKYGRVVQTGSQQRSLTPNRHGYDLIRKGVIGKIHTVIASNYPSPWDAQFPGQPVPQGLDWDAWFGPTEPVAFHNDIFISRANPGWISLRPYSGGEMTGWGAHGLDQIQWVLGKDNSGPVEIWVEGARFTPPTFTGPHKIEDGNARCAHPKVFFRYADGPIVKLENTYCTGRYSKPPKPGEGPDAGAVFLGEKGKIIIDRNLCRVEPAELDADPVDPRIKFTLTPHFRNWFDCIRSRERPVSDVEAGHRTATLCHLGNIARWVGRKLTWDPVQEIFPGDEEANRSLSRPRRKAYEFPDIG